MTRMEEQDHHSIRRSHSVVSTLGSRTAAYMQMGANPAWTPMPMPYGVHSMSPQYQVPIYGGQQQQMMPPGPTPFQVAVAQGDMNMKMILDQYAQQGFIQYTGQQQQNQQHNQKH